MSKNLGTFSEIYNHLQTYAAPVLPPGKSREPGLSHAISSLSLHPALEAALHILNADLPSAHFLVRHMQAAPAYEGMFLHGILHWVEGDYDNARAWYGDVCESAVFTRTWTSKEDALAFIGAVETFKREGKGDRDALERQSRREIEEVVRWCTEHFGTERWDDATPAWVRPSEKIRAMGEDMVSGDAGRRKF